MLPRTLAYRGFNDAYRATRHTSTVNRQPELPHDEDWDTADRLTLVVFVCIAVPTLYGIIKAFGVI